MTLKDFGIWYFETGWIIACIVGFAAGWFGVKSGNGWILLSFVIAVAIVGGLAIYGVHYQKEKE